MSVARVRLLVAAVLAVIGTLTLILALASIWYPRMLGSERLWNLNTGAFIDATYICGLEVRKRHVPSGLEGVFQPRSANNQKEHLMVISRNSILQPARSGRWMLGPSLAPKLMRA